jgi:phenol hydroxylase P0 protein
MNPEQKLPTVESMPHYVRFHRITERGFVEFAFGIGSPDLMTELVLPLEGYREFCRTHQVRYLTRDEEVALDAEQLKWRYGQPGITE